jgi:hypothetical protein
VNFVKQVVDTFKRDIEQGFKTADKFYAVTMLEKALEGLPMEIAPRDQEILAWCPPEFQIISWDQILMRWIDQDCNHVAPRRWWPLPEKMS